tara:strand:- start:5550 stop:5927 length:378 start_codon:yes stop_codon:yes gene_type:complete
MKLPSSSILSFPAQSPDVPPGPSAQPRTQNARDNVFDLAAHRGKARPAYDPHRMRVQFADIWADYLRCHYGRAETVAYMFGVTFQTACNWLSGVSRPTGDKVMLEFASHPDRLLAHALTHLDRAA